MALAIAFNLQSPKGLIGVGDMSAFAATMPKATIDKDGELCGVKKEIRLSEKVRPLACPPCNTCPYKGHLEP